MSEKRRRNGGLKRSHQKKRSEKGRRREEGRAKKSLRFLLQMSLQYPNSPGARTQLFSQDVKHVGCSSCCCCFCYCCICTMHRKSLWTGTCRLSELRAAWRTESGELFFNIQLPSASHRFPLPSVFFVHFLQFLRPLFQSPSGSFVKIHPMRCGTPFLSLGN